MTSLVASVVVQWWQPWWQPWWRHWRAKGDYCDSSGYPWREAALTDSEPRLGLPTDAKMSLMVSRKPKELLRTSFLFPRFSSSPMRPTFQCETAANPGGRGAILVRFLTPPPYKSRNQPRKFGEGECGFPSLIGLICWYTRFALQTPTQIKMPQLKWLFLSTSFVFLYFKKKHFF